MSDNKTERLDTYSKILLATQTINYLGHRLDGVIVDYRTMVNCNVDTGEQGFDLKKSLFAKEEFLKEILSQVHSTAECIADYLNNIDAVAPIDEMIVNPAFDILHGYDTIDQEEEIK